MDATPQQRVDIAQLVGEYQGKSPRRVKEELAEAPPPVVEPPRRRRQPDQTEPWYVVIDEIIEGRVTLEAWPWPSVNPATRFLSFDLSQTRRFTWEADELHPVVSDNRSTDDSDPAARRPLRIGDVFEVTATDITDLTTWTAVRDHTQQKRAEARAALDAMATPPHPTERAEQMEQLARQQEPDVEPAVESVRAHPVV
jgi:hypothetical protein